VKTTLLSKNSGQTKKIAAAFAKNKTRVWALKGNLGSGKTTFAQGFIKALGIKTRVLSPTFIIFRVYPLSGGRKLYHVDLYRIAHAKELKPIGFAAILKNPQNILLIEWAEKIKKMIPPKAAWVTFTPQSRKDEVLITVE